MRIFVFKVGMQTGDKQEYEDRRVERPKRCDDNNKDRDNSSRVNNVDNS